MPEPKSKPPAGATHSGPLRANPERLWATLERSAEIGPGRKGGLCRLAGSDADKAMRDQFAQWCAAADLTLTVDRIGNMFARREGTDDGLPPVTMGSHLDTQYAGGRYDGILGVLAGLEVMRCLNDRGIRTRRPIELINWTNEEGCRFSPPMACSGAFAGVFEPEWVMARTDDDGLVQGAEMKRIGYVGKAAVGGQAFDSYFELHIEQGPILDAEGIEVGIVVGGYKTHGMQVEFQGDTAHAGPTPMDKRRDALVAAARAIAANNDIGWTYHPTGGKTTAPRLVAWPNKAGIISEWAQLNLDVRHSDPKLAAEMRDALEAAIAQACRKAQCTHKVVTRWEFGNEQFDKGLIDLVRSTAVALGASHKDMLSQAGHDAYNISKVAPTVMIFTPCKDGITHNEAEHIEPRTTMPGVNVLLNAVIARADR